MIGFDKTCKFKLEDSRVRIDLSSGIYGYIDLAMYNFLFVLNNKSLNDVRILIHKLANSSDAVIDTLIERLFDCFPFFKDQDESEICKELPFFGKTNKKLNLNRIRRFIPNELVIQVTRTCPMHCKYCYAGSNNEKFDKCSNDLPLETIEKILIDAKSIGINHVDLTGGDPLIRKDSIDIFKLFAKHQMKTSFSTKLIIDNNYLDKLTELGCVDEIQVSIDSLFDGEEEKLLGISSYVDAHLKFIENLIEKGFFVKTNSVITKYNIDRIKLLIDKLISLGVKNIVLSPYMSNLYNRNEDFFPSVEQYTNLSNLLKEYDSLLLQYPTFLNDFNENYLYLGCDSACGACLNGMLVASDGTVAICERMSYFPEYSIGDIKSQTLIEIWNSQKIYKYFDLEKTKFLNTKCYDCKHFNYCVNARGLCFVHSLVLNHSIYAPDSSCVIQNDRRRIY